MMQGVRLPLYYCVLVRVIEHVSRVIEHVSALWLLDGYTGRPVPCALWSHEMPFG